MQRTDISGQVLIQRLADFTRANRRRFLHRADKYLTELDDPQILKEHLTSKSASKPGFEKWLSPFTGVIGLSHSTSTLGQEEIFTLDPYYIAYLNDVFSKTDSISPLTPRRKGQNKVQTPKPRLPTTSQSFKTGGKMVVAANASLKHTDASQ